MVEAMTVGLPALSNPESCLFCESNYPGEVAAGASAPLARASYPHLNRGFCKMTLNRLGTPGPPKPPILGEGRAQMHAEIPFSLPVKETSTIWLVPRQSILQGLGEEPCWSILPLLTLNWGESSQEKAK